MGWAHCGFDDEGREIGYAVEATCDRPGCDTVIDRGLGHVCGGMHGGDEFSCGRYFCGNHLWTANLPNGECRQLCRECTAWVENWRGI